MTKLIGLIGEAGSGKDTVADYIIAHYNADTYTLARPIKELTRHLFLFNDEQLYGKSKNIIDERWNLTPRQTWQIIGTNIMQFSIYGLLPDLLEKVPVRQFWIYHFKMWYQQFLENPANNDKIVIVTDIRFQHEADMITELSGQLIKIQRPDLDKSNQLYQHSSETAMSTMKSDVTLFNNGTLDDLYNIVDKMIKNIYE
jgi:hypothetical protein